MHACWISVGVWIAIAASECTSHGETSRDVNVADALRTAGMEAGGCVALDARWDFFILESVGGKAAGVVLESGDTRLRFAGGLGKSFSSADEEVDRLWSSDCELIFSRGSVAQPGASVESWRRRNFFGRLE
jgi:hypothetical protein